jgi:hypothetical protein
MQLGTRMLAAAVAAVALCTAVGCEEDDGKHQCDIGREQGAGYPSACVPEDGCSDGDSICGAISSTHNIGVCAKPCESDADCAVDLPCTAVGRCILEHETTGQMLCAYTCEAEEDCPINMTCAGYSNLHLCYPPL